MTQSKFVFKVEYKSGVNGRVARFYVKAPYGGAYGLGETLMRAYLTGQIKWFRIKDIAPGELTLDLRSSLLRWPQALEASTARTKVVFGE
ncbi:MAG TPA: hypothetical protein VFX15_03135 [Actinomycetes bacterium]|nr:hypothetical protein [Actinomycetes bacterium]